MSKNLFITFEGIDGCGKDTQLLRLVEAIRTDNNDLFGDKYSNVWITREPTKITEHGKKISRLIREKDVSAEEASQLYVADRKEHSRMIEKKLLHSHVLSSRYDLSTLMYQMTQGLSFDYLYNLHNFEEKHCLIPDITIVFSLPAEVAFERVKGRDSAQECFEKIEFQKKLADNLNYCVNRLAEKGRDMLIINAFQPIEDVTKEMITKIQHLTHAK